MDYHLAYHLAVDALLLFLLLFSEIRNILEKRSLLDRIMCKDFSEYMAFRSSRKHPFPVKKKEEPIRL